MVISCPNILYSIIFSSSSSSIFSKSIVGFWQGRRGKVGRMKSEWPSVVNLSGSNQDTESPKSEWESQKKWRHTLQNVHETNGPGGSFLESVSKQASALPDMIPGFRDPPRRHAETSARSSLCSGRRYAPPLGNLPHFPTHLGIALGSCVIPPPAQNMVTTAGSNLFKEKVLAMPKSSAQVTEAKGTFLHQLSKEATNKPKPKKAVPCID